MDFATMVGGDGSSQSTGFDRMNFFVKKRSFQADRRELPSERSQLRNEFVSAGCHPADTI